MTRPWFLLFLIEGALFFLITYLMDLFYLDQPDYMILAKVFIFGVFWVYIFNSLKVSQFYRQIIKVVLLYSLFALTISIGFPSVFFTNFLLNVFAICIWAALAYVVRYLSHYIGFFKTRVLCSLELGKKLPNNNKIQVNACDGFTLADLVDAEVLVIDEETKNSNDSHRIISHAHVLGLKVLTLREFSSYVGGKFMLQSFDSDWLSASLKRPKIYGIIKRVWELALISIFLPIILLTVAFVSLLILIFMGRPIFFIQERMGLSGKPFRIYKFRTMLESSELKGETLEDDVRITKLGRVLRKFRLDELPQILNIYKGNMNLIGPRPEWSETAGQFNEELDFYSLRNIVKPGITGWAQVMQGHATGKDGNYEKLQYDLYYIRHFSFSLDMMIFFKTILTLLTGKGAK
ncbi:sugar transferase [Francisellaceae bacterium]|nr:sugar transferase [Francisellaceae bacterium]